MLDELAQLAIVENQLNFAMEIVMQQKKRYERLQSRAYGFKWTCEKAEKDDEIANGILSAIGGIECAIENLYN